MLGLRSGHTRKPRGFGYQPRFYDPEAEERRKRQLRFTRPSERRSYKTKQPQFVAVGLGLVLAFANFFIGSYLALIAMFVAAMGAIVARREVGV